MVNRNLFYEELNKLQSRKANMIQSALSARNNTIEAAMNQRSIVRPQTDTSDPSQNFIRDSRSSAPKGETEDTNGYMLDTKSMRTSLEHVQAVRQAAEAARRLAQQRQNQKQQTALDENGGTLLDEMNPTQRKAVASTAMGQLKKQAQTAAYVMNATAQYPSMHAEYEKAAADYKKATEQYELAKKEYAKAADDEDAYKESDVYKEELRLAQTPIENASTVEELKHNLDIYNAKAEAAMALLNSSHLLYDRKSYEQASQTYDMYSKLQTQTQQDYNNAVDKEIEANREGLLAQGYHAANFGDNTWRSVLRGYYESKYYKEMALEALGFENNADYWAEKLEDDKFKFFSDNHADQAVSGASSLVGQMGAELLSYETFFSTVAAVGFAVTAGNAGPGALLPEEVFTIPAALAYGINYGMSVTGAQIEMGMAYVEMIEAGVDRDTAVLISLGVGTVNGILEALQLDDVFKAFKVLDKAGLDNTFTKRLTQYLLDQGVHIAKETGQEVAQEMVTIAGVNLGKAKSGLETDSIEDIGQRLKDTAVSSALTFGMLNVAGMSGRLMNTAITRESLGKLSDSQKYATDEAVTKAYAEQLREQGYSEKGTEHFVKESEANRTSPNAAVEHAVQLVNEMNQEAHSIVEENAQANIQTPIDISRLNIQDIVSLNNAQLKGMSIPQLKTLITNAAELNAQTMGFAQDKILQYIDESTKSNDKLTLIRNFEGIQGDLSVDIEYMGGRNKRIAKRENGPKIGVQITVETHDAFQNKMNQFDTKTIGFEKYCGEQEVLAGIQTAVDSLFTDFTFLFEQKPIAIRYIDLQTTNDFAMIRKKDPYTILLNKRIFDDTAYLKREYDKYQERGYFVKGTDYRAIVYHEFGHLLNQAYKGLYKALSNVISVRAKDSNVDMKLYIRKNISKYATEAIDTDGNYHEALPEILAGAYSGNDLHKELLYDILKEEGYEVR